MPPPETDAERFVRYQAKGVERVDLSGPVALSGESAWDLTVWTTREVLEDESGERRVAIPRLPAGNELEVYVDATHPVFTECGRDVRDFAVLEAATTLAAHANDGARPASQVTADLLLSMPDQRFTEPLLRERVETVLNRVRETTLHVVADDPEGYWAALPAEEKEAAEVNASAASAVDWPSAVDDGAFISFVTAKGIATLVREHPGTFLDGSVFSPAWRHWQTEEARERAVERVARTLDLLGDFLADNTQKSPAELTVVRVSTEQLVDQLRSDETL